MTDSRSYANQLDLEKLAEDLSSGDAEIDGTLVDALMERALGLERQVREWAEALDVIHTKTFIGPGPHPELEAFQALEKRLRDTALKGKST